MPQTTAQIAAGMRESPLYGKSPLFTRMANGLTWTMVIAQATSKLDASWLIANSTGNVAEILARLYSPTTEDSWIDSIDENNPGSVTEAARSLRDKIGAMTRATTSGKKEEKTQGSKNLQEIATLLELSKLVEDADFSDILGPVSSKLKKIVAVGNSEIMKTLLPALNAKADQRAVIAELTEIKNELRRQKMTSLEVIRPAMEEGARDGISKVQTLVPEGITLTVDGGKILELVSGRVASGYADGLSATTGELEEKIVSTFGNLVAALIMMALNKKVFESMNEAVDIFGKYVEKLNSLPPFYRDWNKIPFNQVPMIRKAIKDFDFTGREVKPKGLPDNEVKEILLRGATAGLAEARALFTGSAVPVDADQAVMKSIQNTMGKALRSTPVTDEAETEALAQRIAALTLMATYKKSFASPTAQSFFSDTLAKLPSDWSKLVEPSVAESIKRFATVAPAKTTNKENVIRVFTSGMEGQAAVVAQKRHELGMPEKEVGSGTYTQSQVDGEFQEVAAAYYAYIGRKGSGIPTDDQIQDAGATFYRMMLVFASGVQERSDMTLMQTCINELNQRAWPGWKEALKGHKGWARGGIVETIIDDHIEARNRSQMSRIHYRDLFRITYSKFEEKVKQGIETNIRNACPQEPAICNATNALRAAIGSDNLLLAKPAAIGKMFNMPPPAFSGQGLMILTTVLRDVGDEEEITPGLLNSMADEILLHIAMEGQSENQPYGDWGRLDNIPELATNPNLLKKERENRQKAEQAATKLDVWTHPTAMMVCAIALAYLERGAKGIQIV